MARVAQSSIRAGERVTMLAERLLQADTPSVHLPRYVRELRDAARFPRGPGDENLFEQAVRQWRRQVERLGQGVAGGPGEYTLRSTTQRLIADLRRAKPLQVERIVDRWILDRARYQARVVARNEAVQAARDVQVEGLRAKPWSHGVRWTLSGSHPRPDICDVLANQDLYGLGPGGYPLDAIPKHHPSCLCFYVSISDPHYLQRETAKVRGEPEPDKPWLSGIREAPGDWLKRQDKETQVAIAGPTRAKLLERGAQIMTPDKSSFRKVHNLPGKPAPVRDMGPKVDATPLVSADRASMRQQFPAL